MDDFNQKFRKDLQDIASKSNIWDKIQAQVEEEKTSETHSFLAYIRPAKRLVPALICLTLVLTVGILGILSVFRTALKNTDKSETTAFSFVGAEGSLAPSRDNDISVFSASSASSITDSSEEQDDFAQESVSRIQKSGSRPVPQTSSQYPYPTGDQYTVFTYAKSTHPLTFESSSLDSDPNASSNAKDDPPVYSDVCAPNEPSAPTDASASLGESEKVHSLLYNEFMCFRSACYWYTSPTEFIDYVAGGCFDGITEKNLMLPTRVNTRYGAPSITAAGNQVQYHFDSNYTPTDQQKESCCYPGSIDIMLDYLPSCKSIECAIKKVPELQKNDGYAYYAAGNKIFITYFLGSVQINCLYSYEGQDLNDTDTARAAVKYIRSLVKLGKII